MQKFWKARAPPDLHTAGAVDGVADGTGLGKPVKRLDVTDCEAEIEFNEAVELEDDED